MFGINEFFRYFSELNGKKRRDYLPSPLRGSRRFVLLSSGIIKGGVSLFSGGFPGYDSDGELIVEADGNSAAPDSSPAPEYLPDPRGELKPYIQKSGEHPFVARNPAGEGYRDIHPRSKSEPHFQIEKVRRTGFRTDFEGFEARGWDDKKRGNSQFDLSAKKARLKVTPAHGSIKSGVPTPVHTVAPKPGRAPSSSHSTSQSTSERRIAVLKRFVGKDVDPIKMLENLKVSGDGGSLQPCCAAAVSRMLSPYRIEGVKRLTSENQDIIEIIILPAIRNVSTFLSLAFTVDGPDGLRAALGQTNTYIRDFAIRLLQECSKSHVEKSATIWRVSDKLGWGLETHGLTQGAAARSRDPGEVRSAAKRTNLDCKERIKVAELNAKALVKAADAKSEEWKKEAETWKATAEGRQKTILNLEERNSDLIMEIGALHAFRANLLTIEMFSIHLSPGNLSFPSIYIYIAPFPAPLRLTNLTARVFLGPHNPPYALALVVEPCLGVMYARNGSV